MATRPLTLEEAQYVFDSRTRVAVEARVLKLTDGTGYHVLVERLPDPGGPDDTCHYLFYGRNEAIIHKDMLGGWKRAMVNSVSEVDFSFYVPPPVMDDTPLFSLEEIEQGKEIIKQAGWPFT